MRELDFTGISAEMTGQGSYTVVPPGTYPAKVTAFHKRISEAGNDVFDIDLEIVNGEYEGVGLRMFQGVSQKVYSRKRFLQALTALNIIADTDRRSDGSLKVRVNYGSTDANGRDEVLSFTVNDTNRPVLGRYVNVVVVNRPKINEPNTMQHWVEELQKMEGTAEVFAETNGRAIAANDDEVPF
jgi:hypothetical protein